MTTLLSHSMARVRGVFAAGVCAVLAALAALPAHAVIGAADNVPAAGSSSSGTGLRLPLASGADRNQPTYVTADRVEGVADREVTAEGRAELRKGDVTIGADRLKYLSASEDVEAVGHVRIQRRGDVIEGPSLKYHLPDSTGLLDKPQYSLAPRTRSGDKRENVNPVAGRGKAEELAFKGEDQYDLKDATFTTCKLLVAASPPTTCYTVTASSSIVIGLQLRSPRPTPTTACGMTCSTHAVDCMSSLLPAPTAHLINVRIDYNGASFGARTRCRN